ncbi:hypothetical protein ACFLZV_06435, partial [Candidatus Margulisiibacteriota bacterium]
MLKLGFVFICSLIIYYVLILLLVKYKWVQRIYELSPQTHLQKKNVPSFGGVGIFLCLIIGLFIYKAISPEIIWCVCLFGSFAIVGFIDDFLAIAHKRNEGFSPLIKFMVQSVLAVVFLLVFSHYMRSLGFVEYLLYWFVIVGTTNATNLSDGLDGLLPGLALITLLGLFIYLGSIEMRILQLIPHIIMISMLAFLFFNFKPARIFLGDTGALALGALFAGLSIVVGNPWILIF